MVGIIFVGSPDLFPPARRFSTWFFLRVGTITHRVLRFLGRRPRDRTISAGACVYGITEYPASLVWGVGKDASLEQKFAYLLRRDEQARREERARSGRAPVRRDGAPGASDPTEEDEPWDVYRKRELLRKFDERVVDLDKRYEWI